MTMLIVQLAILLLAAAGVGVFVGWQVQRHRGEAQFQELDARANRVCHEHAERAEAAQSELETVRQSLGNMRADYKQASRRLRNLTGALSDSESTIAGLEADVAALYERLDQQRSGPDTPADDAERISADDAQAIEVPDTDGRIAALETTLSERDAAIAALRKLVDSRDAALHELRAQLATLLEAEQQLRDEMAIETSRRETLAEKYELLSARADSDDLKRIKGIGPVLEKSLKEHGITRFSQIASFEPADIETISASLQTFPDRIRRDRWVEQAAELAGERETGGY